MVVGENIPQPDFSVFFKTAHVGDAGDFAFPALKPFNMDYQLQSFCDLQPLRFL